MASPEVTRKAILDTIRDMEYNARYCSSMADRNQSRYRRTRLTNSMSMIIGVVLLFGGTVNPWLFVLVAIPIAVLLWISLWGLEYDYARDAAAFRAMSSMYHGLGVETSILWKNVEIGSATNAEAREELDRIWNQLKTIKQPISSRINTKLDHETFEAANQEMQRKYGDNTTLSATVQ